MFVLTLKSSLLVLFLKRILETGCETQPRQSRGNLLHNASTSYLPRIVGMMLADSDQTLKAIK
jgi:hypothetical protein